MRLPGNEPDRGGGGFGRLSTRAALLAVLIMATLVGGLAVIATRGSDSGPDSAETSSPEPSATSAGPAVPTTSSQDIGFGALPPPANTTPPSPSTTANDSRPPQRAYEDEFARYCQHAFAISPDGALVNPDVMESFGVDDCLDWIEPTWGASFDTASEAAEAGIADAIAAMTAMTTLSEALCWMDPTTDEWGGCWYIPNG